MEAAPRLPMISFDPKVCSENTQFGPQLKQYIAAFYNEDPDSYSTEIHNLEQLRAIAVRPTMDINGVQLLKKYYCQLHFLKSRFPMEEGQDAAVQFLKDNQAGMNCGGSDIRFELMVIMYNIGALHSYLGATDSRNSPEGMKMACTHFQCAAWAFQTVKEKYHQFVIYISSVELVHFFQQVCLAQAQECILEKSMLDNRKATIIAKVAVQVHSYYRQSLSILQSTNDELVGSKSYKEWIKPTGRRAAENGERVAFYQAACEQLEEARKISSGLKHWQQEINESLAFSSDVVEGKKEKQRKTKTSLSTMKRYLTKTISKRLKVSGQDIFARLVPMEAHEAASLYSESKAQMLRQMGELVENKDQNIAEFMSSMQLDLLTKMNQATGIPQELIDRAAALSARPNVIQDLVDVMGKLSNIYQDVESNLNEIDALLKEEEEAEKHYQELMGKRPPSIVATDLAREAAKYREAHTKANDSNQTLHRAMTAHIANLKILQQPLRSLQHQLPFVQLPNPNIDEKALKDLETLVSKVEEMRNQRAMLWAQFRDAVHKDDITNSLVTKQPESIIGAAVSTGIAETSTASELKRNNKYGGLIEQNCAAQENIRKALVDAYARAVNTRRYIQEIIQKRNSTISALITSHDSYEDLIAKAKKGIEFYIKLETNVSKLLQRIKSACKVQQEEREQMLQTNDIPKQDTSAVSAMPDSASATPKLKDYLDSRKKNPVVQYHDPNLQYHQQQQLNYGMNMPDTQTWPPGIRPAPLGSEVTDLPKNSSGQEAMGYSNTNMQYGYPQEHQGLGHAYPYQVNNYPTPQQPPVDQDIIKRMNNLLSSLKGESTSQNKRQYSFTNYIPQNYAASTTYMYPTQAYTSVTQSESFSNTYDPNKAYTTTTNSYRPLQSSTTPDNSNAHMQYRDTNTVASNPNNESITYQYPQQPHNAGQPQSGPAPGQSQNINTYYPTGYAPKYLPQNVQASSPSEQGQYHSLQYATSVQQNQKNNSYMSTYSSPTINMSSVDAGSSQAQFMQGAYPTSDAANVGTPTSHQAGVSSSSYPITGTPNLQQSVVPNVQGYSVDGGSTAAPNHMVGQYSSAGTPDVQQMRTGPAATHYSSASTPVPQQFGSASLASQYPISGTHTPQQMGSASLSSGQYLSADISTGQQGGSTSHTGAQQPAAGTSQFYSSSYPTSSTQQPVPSGTASDSQSISSGYQSYQMDANYSPGVSAEGGTQAAQYYQTYSTGTTGTQQEYQSDSGTSLSSDTTGYGAYPAYYQQGYPQNYAVNYNYAEQQITGTVLPTTKESNVDLLSGLDFTISQAPLIPQQKTLPKSEESEVKKTASESKFNVVKKPPGNEDTPAQPEIKRLNVKILPSKPLNNNDVKQLFAQELEKYEKYVETLTSKTLSGPTNLDLKWKEIQDSEGQKRIISVARCYPMKNRFPDILPYDHSRVELYNAKDDYINASYVKEVSLYAPAFIVTQAPLSSTFGDFWTMIREQQVELIFCLLSDSEIGDDMYWPKERGQPLNILNMVITLQSVIVKSHWVERLISVNLPEKRDSWVVMHLQFTSWPGSLNNHDL
ncbi:hypothetical protein NQ317_017454 [Molorchus minor]|uniref:Tyrosine-protein phosphatase non-receptor type 23 n=1 Tax=Molorchus minor TaxID=1323400 RepID=A0ABQ9J4G6_9CUCU|nr:hypothetical protein NQ317_017454 [Molorchus minor]